MNRKNFLALSALILASAFSPISQAEDNEKPPFKTPQLEDIIDKNQATVERQGTREESVIVIPMLHPPSKPLFVNEAEKAINVIQKCKKSAFAVYDACMSRRIIMEGLDEQCAEKHNKGGKLNLTNAHGYQTQFFDEYSDLINSRNWHVIGIPNANEPLTNLDRINRNYEDKLQEITKGWDKKGWSESKEKFDANGKEAMAELTALINNYILEVVDYYEREDPQGKDLVKKYYADQNSRVLALAKPSLKEKQKVIIVCGAWHEHGLRKEMEASQVNYAIIRAQDVPPYHPLTEEEIAERVKKETLTFMSPLSIWLKGIKQPIEVDPQLKKRNFYKKYISPDQK